MSGNSESEVLRNLRNMNLGDDFWMYAFKASLHRTAVVQKFWRALPKYHLAVNAGCAVHEFLQSQVGWLACSFAFFPCNSTFAGMK